MRQKTNNEVQKGAGRESGFRAGRVETGRIRNTHERQDGWKKTQNYRRQSNRRQGKV